MSSTTRDLLIGAVIVVIIVLLGYSALQEKQGSETSPATTVASSTGTSLPVSDSTTNGSTTSGVGYTIRPITGNAPTPPDHSAPLSFPASMSTEEQGSDQSQFETLQTTFATSPNDWASWIALGILRQESGDYAGAAADWTYITELYPNDPTAFADLANMDATYLNEPSQAIALYKKAIQLDATKEATFYENLAQVYISQNDTADAKAILQQGINVQVVGYQNLVNMLSSMQ